MKSVRELKQKKISFSLNKHSGDAYKASEASRELGLKLSQIVKSILLGDKNGHTVLVLLPGDKKIDVQKVRRQSGFAKLRLADPKIVLAVSGYQVGLVTTFGLTKYITIFIDQTILNYDEVGISSGETGLEIILNPNELLKATLGLIGDFVQQ